MKPQLSKTEKIKLLIFALIIFLFAVLFTVWAFKTLKGRPKAAPDAEPAVVAENATSKPAEEEPETRSATDCPERYIPTVCFDFTEYDNAPEFTEPLKTLSAGDGFVYRESYYDALTERRERIPMTEEWQRYLYEVSAKYGIPAELTLAVTGMETCFDVHIGSRFDQHGNEYYGAGMVSVDCAEEHLARLGITLCTPEGGLEAVAYILREKLDEFPGDIHKALIAYNCGSYGAQTLFDKGITETDYSKRVLQIMEGF